MTTLLIVQLPDGTHRCCAAWCHHAHHRRSRCICGGAYHGLGDPSEALRRAVAERWPAVLTWLAAREEAGELLITAWREALDGPLLWRARLRAPWRHEQLALGVSQAGDPPGSSRG